MNGNRFSPFHEFFGFHLAAAAMTFLVCMPLFSDSLAAKQLASGESADIDRPTDEAPVSDFENTWTIATDIIQTLLDNHVSPPAKQQMFLNFARGMYYEADNLPPRELAARFSAMESDEAIKSALKEIWDQNIDGNFNRASHAVYTNILHGVKGQVRFVPAADSRVNRQLSENQYVGIGVVVAVHEGLPMITKPIIGGAAHTAGAKPGDLIVEVDGRSTEGEEFRDVIMRLRGPVGSSLTVDVRNKEEDEVRTLELVRAVIPIPSVESISQNDDATWNIMIPDTTIAHFKFKQIVGSTSAELRMLINQARRESATAIILDFSEMDVVDGPVIDVHHSTMLADVLLNDANIGTLYEETGQVQLLTSPEAMLEDLPIVLCANGRVPAPLFAVLKSVADLENVTVIGSRVTTDGLCHTEVPLAANPNLAVLDHVPYGLLVPNESQEGRDDSATHEPDSNHDPELDRFSFEADVMIDRTEITPAARRILETSTAG
ncbi:MAG: PDZ domain-containing protein [Planctomycetota bacterium]